MSQIVNTVAAPRAREAPESSGRPPGEQFALCRLDVRAVPDRTTRSASAHDQRRRPPRPPRRPRDEFELLLLEEFELLLLEEFELLLLDELELLLLDELDELLLDELDELLPATTIGFSVVSPAASASISRPRSGNGECDQSPSLVPVGICLAMAEPPASNAVSAPSDTNILRFMSPAPHRPDQ
jgi:hypothetical protein